MQQRQTMLTTQAPQAQPPAALLKLLQQQNGKGPDSHFQANDLDMASAAALAQHFQGLQQQRAPTPQQQAYANATNAAGNAAAANQMAMLALMQSNPLLAQSLGLGGGMQAGNAGTNPQQAAIMAAALAQAQQAQARANIQQAAIATLLRNQGAAGANNAAAAAAFQKMANQAQQGGLPGARAPAQAAAAAAQNAQLLALQRAAAAQVTQMMQQQQQQANPAITQAQVLAALAAQQQKQVAAAQQLQQAQHLQALKAVLERNNSHQQPQLGGYGNNQQGNTAALLKQLQLQEALAKQDALARAAQAHQNNGTNPALTELLLRQQAAQEMAAQDAAMAQRTQNLKAAFQSMQPGNAAMMQQQQQSALERAVQHQQQQQAAHAQAQLQAAANMAHRNGANTPQHGSGMNNHALDLLLAQQQQQQQAQAHAANAANNAAKQHSMNGNNANGGGMPNGAGLEGVSGLAGLNGNAALGNKEQRRLALACVALQLARSGVSVEQAIQSGIMGGMSVVDVRFIVECYNAERERMAAGGGSSSTDGRGLPQQQSNASNGLSATQLSGGTQARSGHTSRTHSPAASIAGSHMSLFSQPQANGGHTSSMLNANSLVAGAGASSLSDHAHDVTQRGMVGYGGPSEHSSPHSAATRTSQDHAAGPSLPAPALEDASGNNFNAFNYGFFSNKEGDLLGELEPDGDASSAHDSSALESFVPPEGVTEEQLAWLRSTADAHRARWEGAGETTTSLDVWGKDDDLAARLANLDLGSGFM